MQVEFLKIAEQELLDAINYYNDQMNGLGYQFASEIKKTVNRIIKYPEAWTKISNRARRCICNRFPYGVIYQIRKDFILIISIMHLSKKPDYWVDRFYKD